MARLVRFVLLAGLLLVVSIGVFFVHAFCVRWNFAGDMVRASAVHVRLTAKEFDTVLSPAEALIAKLYFNSGGDGRRRLVCPALQNLLTPSRSKSGPAHYLANGILAENRGIGTF
ncbi:MAG: hypothetical protein KAH44_01880, partial [Oricola sp.]|nr:hypothetical protein [Oricola sp.]